MPKDSPPGPNLGLKELEAIAWAEARRSPDLTPNGGRRWTREDNEFAIAILDEQTRSTAFRRAWAAGMTRGAARLWLSKALHNRLLDYAERVRRLMLVDHLALDDLPRARDDRTHLSTSDREILARKALARLSAVGRIVAAEYFQHDGMPTTCESKGGRPWEIAPRTRGRERARLRRVLRTIIEDAGLNWDEALDLLFALSAKLTGGGRSVGRIQESVADFGTLDR